MTNSTPGRDEFRQATLAKYPAEAMLHRDVSMMLEGAVLTSRFLADLVHRAVDMLFVQAFKAHQSVYELSALCLTEDAAAIVRRLLELAAQAVWIAKDSEVETCQRRAGMYLAFLWVKWPAERRGLVPAEERAAWERVTEQYGGDFTADRKQWGPNFGQIFDAIEKSERDAGGPVGEYRDTYSYLSNVAHGSPPSLVHSYSGGTIQVHDSRLVGQMLIFGTLYVLSTASVWNDIYHIIPTTQFDQLKVRALALVPKVPHQRLSPVA